VVSREEALSRIQKQNEPYKIELLEAIPKGELKILLSMFLQFYAAVGCNDINEVTPTA
jgi:hypothetical protein